MGVTMEKIELNRILTRRSALGVFAAAALGSVAVLSGCDSNDATVDSGSSSTKESKKDDNNEEQKTTDLAVGTSITTSDNVTVVVDSVETGLTNYDGSTMTGIHVTYTNNGDDGADYNVYDWKGEDANGAQQSSGYYSEGSDTLESGTLAEGGTVSGNIYFDGDIKKALYFGNIFEKSATASWVLA